MTDSLPAKKQVLVIGGGFGGLKAALELSKHDDFAVTVLSDHPTFRYYPALYHTATGGLYAQSNIPIADILPKHVTIIQGTAQTLDREKHVVITDDRQELHYEILILGIGAVTNYFGIEGLEEYTYGIKSWGQIQRFKHHLHEQLETDHKPDLNYVIVGAGPTGIELAGALPGYLDKVMRNHGIKDVQPKITIIEGAPRLLPRSPEKVSQAVAKRLEALGIELQLGQKVEGATADSLMVNGNPISSHTIVWTAGTANHPFFKNNNFTLTKRGKVQVDEFLRAEEGIYIVGDNADTLYSGLAQTALRDGLFAAEDIVRRAEGKNPVPYAPRKPIIVMPVGYGWASIEWGNRIFGGMIGWWLHKFADYANFHDLEPWWRASEQAMTEYGEQEDCPTCLKK